MSVIGKCITVFVKNPLNCANRISIKFYASNHKQRAVVSSFFPRKVAKTDTKGLMKRRSFIAHVDASSSRNLVIPLFDPVRDLDFEYTERRTFVC